MTLLLASTPGQGLIVPLLLIFVGVGAVMLSVLGRWLLPQVPGWKVYAFSPFVAAALLYGFYLLRLLLDAVEQGPARAEYRRAYAQLDEGFALGGWSVDLDPARMVLTVEYTVQTEAKVSVTVIGGSLPAERGAYPRWHLVGQSEPQRSRRTVPGGQTCRVDVPLERYLPGQPEAWVLTFEIESVPSPAVVLTKLFATHPIAWREQRSLPLPPPSSGGQELGREATGDRKRAD